MENRGTLPLGRVCLPSRWIKRVPLPGAKVEQICLQPIRAPGGFLSRVHGVYLGPLCITPMGRGRRSWHRHEGPAACCAVSNRVFVSDPGVSCLRPASMKPWQDNLFACKWGKAPIRHHRGRRCPVDIQEEPRERLGVFVCMTLGSSRGRTGWRCKFVHSPPVVLFKARHLDGGDEKSQH